MTDEVIEKIQDARDKAKREAKQNRAENQRETIKRLRELGFDRTRMRIGWLTGGIRYPGVGGVFGIIKGDLYQVTYGGRECDRVDSVEDIELSLCGMLRSWWSRKMKRDGDAESVEQED